MSVPNLLSKSTFAAWIGKSPSYPAQGHGRLVLSPGGKQVGDFVI